MNVKSLFLLPVLVIFTAFACNKEPEEDPGPDPGPEYPEEVFIENDELKLGINTTKGGAITYLARKDDNINLVNNHDLGRQIQISFYAFPVPYAPSPDKQPHPRWEGIGWNPIQAGDVAGNGSKILDLWYEGDSLYVRCIPMHWPLDDVPGECEYESRIKLVGNKVFANAKIINKRPDMTQYRARNNEFPAVYTNGTHYKLYSYTGASPFTNDELTLIPKRNVAPGEFPWNRFHATEGWAALLNEDLKGLGVFSPVTHHFLGGFVGLEGAGGTNDGPTGYIAPVGNEILDHNVEFDYNYVLITGSLDQIRTQVYELADQSGKQLYSFKNSRSHWYYWNLHDEGWPIQDGLKIEPDESSANLVGPDQTFYADSASTVVVNAAFKTSTSGMTLMWKRLGDDDFDRTERSTTIPLINDGTSREYIFDLGEHAGYGGLITKMQINFNNLNTNSDWMEIYSIESK